MAPTSVGRGEDDESFANLVDVDRRVEQHERLPPDAGARASKPGAGESPPAASPPQFVQPNSSVPLLGYVGGVDRATFRRLRDGRIEPEADVDLHGLGSRDARALLERSVRDARDAGRRTLLVVHGRGQHSSAGPVLKIALPNWLMEVPMAHGVLAFAPAAPKHGGAGATLLLLRRSRARKT